MTLTPKLRSGIVRIDFGQEIRSTDQYVGPENQGQRVGCAIDNFTNHHELHAYQVEKSSTHPHATHSNKRSEKGM